MIKSLFKSLSLYKYEYLLLTLSLVILNVFTNSINYNADTLFPYRYASSLYLNEGFKLFVQPGPRFFPDVFYAYIARIFTDNESLNFQLTILINSIVLITALFVFFKNILKSKSSAILLSTIFVISISISLFSITYKLATNSLKGLSEKMLFLNIMNIISPIVMAFAMWAVNLNLLRYIPNIYILSTAILFFNLAFFIKRDLCISLQSETIYYKIVRCKNHLIVKQNYF